MTNSQRDPAFHQGRTPERVGESQFAAAVTLLLLVTFLFGNLVVAWVKSWR